MSGFRRLGDILINGGTEETVIPSSEVESDQPLQMTVFPFGSLDAQVRLEGDAPDLPLPSGGFRESGGIGVVEQLTYDPVEANIEYTVVVRDDGTNSGFGSYLLEISSEDSRNDISNTAVSIGNVSNNPLIDGFVGRSDTDDWYEFEVSGNSQVRLTLDPIQDNAELELYDRGLNLIDSAQAEATNNGLITQTLPTGDYLVRVTADNTSASISDGGRASTEYTLAVQQISGNPGGGNPNPGGGGSSGGSQDVLRFWNFSSLSHIFTANQAEIDELTGQPTSFRAEGNEFDVPVNDGDPVFRYLNTATDSIFLSFESGIENSLPQFINTGVAFNAYRPVGTTEARPADAPANAIPVYRLTNLDAEQANPLNITHFYTSDPNNRQLVLDTLNYRDEFVGFWALPPGTDGLV
ncbi:MAG: hypothetical protein F6K54_23775 [Okeania sp. SIO3B5]|uniref:pre-peptidase C-terminal domain-containing protein n=1 Tax=Okeania sp. SIO3B5 TaxID=2607811 RepID=UPI0013FF783A|nr:pre-peptidase C-terminal domain-containing protein [Okeania sp. SIO3B5]NEO55820.1 hypothetical protein [Okeania sp. SIO3B5]